MAAATTPSLATLIEQIKHATPNATPTERVTEAQTWAHRLAEMGEQLVGYFVSAAKTAGASWAEIGEALGVSRQAAQQRGTQVFARYDDWARHAIVLSQESARSHQHHHIGTAHLLLGILGEPRGLGARLLVRHAGSAERAEATVTGTLPPAAEGRSPAKIPFTADAKLRLGDAVRAADDLGHEQIGTEHLLLALLRSDDATTAALAELGMDHDRIRDEIRDEIAAHERPTAAPPAG